MPNWIAHPLAERVSGQPSPQPSSGAKHGTLVWCPWEGQWLYMAGDNGGKTGTQNQDGRDVLQPYDGDNNYRNEVWSLNPDTMLWTVRQPYCLGYPSVRPHRPDWCAFVPDTTRQRMHFWPGQSFLTIGSLKPGQTDHYCSLNEFAPWLDRSDYPKPRQPHLTFNPFTDEWEDPQIPLETYVDSGGTTRYITGNLTADGAVYDPVNDEMIRVCFRDGNSGPLVAQHLSMATKTFRYVLIKTPQYPSNITNSSVGRTWYFLDSVTRKIWFVDGAGWEVNPDDRGKHCYLCSYHVDTGVFAREGMIPGVDDLNIWMSTTGISECITFHGDPELRRAWWVINGWDVSLRAYGMLPGETEEEVYQTIGRYDWTDVYKVLELNLDTLVWSDITPTGVTYPSGGPTSPAAYFSDPRRLAITSGAHGRTIGYDPVRKQLLTCAGFASRDMFSLQVGEAAPPPPPEPDPELVRAAKFFQYIKMGADTLELNISLWKPRGVVDPPVAVDCVLGDPVRGLEEPWGPCVDGERARTVHFSRAIVTEAANGGAACGPTQYTEVETEACTPPDTGEMPSVSGTILTPIINMDALNDTREEYITLAWNGAAFDYANKIFYHACPGGHGDWGPNEAFACDVENNISWRIHGKTPDANRIVTPFRPIAEYPAEFPRQPSAISFNGQEATVTLASHGRIANYSYVRLDGTDQDGYYRVTATTSGSYTAEFYTALTSAPAPLLVDGLPVLTERVVRVSAVYPDGKPASRHTYPGEIWLPTQQRVMLITGSTYVPSGSADRYCGWLDPTTGAWEHKATWPYAASGCAAVYDASRDVVFHGAGTHTVYTYNPATDTNVVYPRGNDQWKGQSSTPYTSFQTDGTYLYAIKQGGYDSSLPVGDPNKSNLIRRLINPSISTAFERVYLTGDITGLATKSPGFEYDPDMNALVIWAFEQPYKVSIVHLDNLSVEQRTIPSPPGISHTINGVWGRFRRVSTGLYALRTSPFYPVEFITLSV
jgi:hypothetical protein